MSPKTIQLQPSELMEWLNSASWAVSWDTDMASEGVSSVGMQGLHIYT